jgi:hypothetical protein
LVFLNNFDALLYAAIKIRCLERDSKKRLDSGELLNLLKNNKEIARLLESDNKTVTRSNNFNKINAKLSMVKISSGIILRKLQNYPLN